MNVKPIDLRAEQWAHGDVRTEVQDTDKSPVRLGKVVKAQGLRGGIKAVVYSGKAKDFAAYATLGIVTSVGIQQYELQSYRDQGRHVVLTLAGVADRSTAEALVGAEITVSRSQMPELEDDEFYWHDIVGLQVVTSQGRELGRVTSMIATGGHDVMVVTGPDEELLIPYVRDIVVRQDNASGLLIIAPLEGLLEINKTDDAV